ncbi:DUF2226 domain-containing protein [Thermococcus sp.]
MLPGKFVELVINIDNPKELLNKIKEGYLKASWREKDDLVTGYVLVSNGKIVGAIVENLMTGETLKGNDALGNIIQVTKTGKIKVVELYEASTQEILSEMPEAKVDTLSIDHKGESILDDLLSLIISHKGEVFIHDGGTSWRLYLEQGVVKAAESLGEKRLFGDDALRSLLHEMGHIIKEGHYEIGDQWEFTSKEKVKGGNLFSEGVELLYEKQKLEKELNKKRYT